MEMLKASFAPGGGVRKSPPWLDSRRMPTEYGAIEIPRGAAMYKRRMATGAFMVLTASLVVSSCKDQRVDAARDVVTAFQGSCVTTGRWTQAALAHSQALITVMEELKATDACKPFVSTLATIQGLGSQIQSLVQNQSY